jgi:hypothetical protein
MDEILARIRSAYGSLDQPEFHFVGRALNERPYNALIQQLEGAFSVEHDTDPNDDVSFVYLLSADGRRWMLRLSMVGPYALLLRLHEDHLVEVISPREPSSDALEEQVFILLSGNGIRVLAKDELMRRVPLRLFNARPGNVRIYHALFEDTDVLPWESGSE